MADHHGGEKTDEMLRKMRDAALSEHFGPTGDFPRGRLSASDEGGIQFGVAADKGKVILNFGKPVAWLGMDPEDATRLADALKIAADQAARAAERGEKKR